MADGGAPSQPPMPATDVVDDLAEARSTGSVTWHVYMTYLRQMAPNALLLLLLMLFVVSVQALMNASDWWLNKWYCPFRLSLDI